MQVMLHFLKVMISWQTVIVVSLSCLATYLCLRFDVTLDLPTALIGIAIVFPIVFSINAAYRRREEALGYFASLKASAVSLFYAHRDWITEDNPEHSPRMKELIERLLHSIYICLTSRKSNAEHFKQVYALFSQISTSIEKIRKAGVSSTEISRGNQYLRYMMFDFERMRNIHIYRTPTALRAYSHVFLNSFPVLFAPLFAKLSTDYYYVAGYLIAALYCLVLVGLDNIQEDLEHPYDQVGEDDLNLDVAELYSQILTQ
jgi:predicted membrane chloride channel (bestrophin family)